MLHYFKWKAQKLWWETYLINELFGIQVAYAGGQSEGVFFLYPYLDENKKSVFYFAFDDADQKQTFEKMLKISGVWPKTAFQIVQLPRDELLNAIEKLDAKFFQSIPGIGPKLAKKIILELKDSFQLEQAFAQDQHHKIFKSVLKTLKNLGYDAQRVKDVLLRYEGNLEHADLAEVVKWVISQL